MAEKLLIELEDFLQDDVVYPKIGSLSSRTNLQELDELKGLSKEEVEKLNEIEEAYEASNKIQRYQMV